MNETTLTDIFNEMGELGFPSINGEVTKVKDFKVMTNEPTSEFKLPKDHPYLKSLVVDPLPRYNLHPTRTVSSGGDNSCAQIETALLRDIITIDGKWMKSKDVDRYIEQLQKENDELKEALEFKETAYLIENENGEKLTAKLDRVRAPLELIKCWCYRVDICNRCKALAELKESETE